MSPRKFVATSPHRRAFLRGALGVTVGLPFLESLTERSPRAADVAKPVVGLFMCGVGGVVQSDFFPATTGAMTTSSLGAAGKATSQLSAHADNLVLLSGIDWPAGVSLGDSHVDTLCAVYTGRRPTRPTDLTKVLASGPSVDAYIAARVHPDQGPIALYAGNANNAYEANRLSFKAAGQLSPVTPNPYALYLELMGLALPGGAMTPGAQSTAQLLLHSRKSVHDLVRDELTTLMQHPRLGAADKQRLQHHFDSIRDAEKTMTGMGNELVDRCTSVGLDVTTLEALKDYRWDAHRTDEIVGLHMSLVAMAFACNYRRAASLQWGDPYDLTIYDVPSNARGWKMSYIAHRAQSDSAVGSDPLAAKAAAEIDVVRMKTLAAGLDHFKARGLADQCVVTWTNHFADGPLHSTKNVPHIIWGNGGGFLKQGQVLDAGSVTNNRLLNTLLSAVLQDTHATVEDFGQGTGGMLDLLRA